ncbi:MAG: 23S rRNA methyltransferase [Mariprofundaceae bacterium]|nr:23S rRNA methyltransferase [Mariprofundaceae bacterium]
MPDLPVSNLFTGTATHVMPGGEALVHTNSLIETRKTYLVRQAVPGDTLLLSAAHSRRGTLKASLEKIEIASDKRVQAICSAADQCGGCALQYLHTDQHSQIKSEWVLHAFKSVISENTQWLPIQFDEMQPDKTQPTDIQTESGQRRRLRWHVGRHACQQVTLGFRAYQSHDVIEVDVCRVITSPLEALRQSLQAYLTTCETTLPESVYAVQLSDGIHVVLEYIKNAPPHTIASITLKGLPVQYWCRDKQGLKPLNKPVHQLHDCLPTNEEDILVRIGPDDFVQGQMSGNRMMIQQILAWCKGSIHIVDLFSGVGNLSLPLAASGMRILGAEIHEASVRASNANAKRLALQASYQQADLFGDFDVSNFVGADVLIIDPPRKGAKKICTLMNHLLPHKVILVHCDVASAGRDAVEMQRQGYGLRALRALDLFPYSGHVESMSLWAR